MGGEWHDGNSHSRLRHTNIESVPQTSRPLINYQQTATGQNRILSQFLDRVPPLCTGYGVVCTILNLTSVVMDGPSQIRLPRTEKRRGHSIVCEFDAGALEQTTIDIVELRHSHGRLERSTSARQASIPFFYCFTRTRNMQCLGCPRMQWHITMAPQGNAFDASNATAVMSRISVHIQHTHRGAATTLPLSPSPATVSTRPLASLVSGLSETFRARSSQQGHGPNLRCPVHIPCREMCIVAAPGENPLPGSVDFM